MKSEQDQFAGANPGRIGHPSDSQTVRGDTDIAQNRPRMPQVHGQFLHLAGAREIADPCRLGVRVERARLYIHGHAVSQHFRSDIEPACKAIPDDGDYAGEFRRGIAADRLIKPAMSRRTREHRELAADTEFLDEVGEVFDDLRREERRGSLLPPRTAEADFRHVVPERYLLESPPVRGIGRGVIDDKTGMYGLIRHTRHRISGGPNGI